MSSDDSSGLKPDLYHEKKIAATCDSDGRYYFVANPVQLVVENTHDNLANAQLATWVSHVAMHVASHVAMHAVAKVELGSTFAMSRCDSLRQGFPLSQSLSQRESQRFFIV